MSTLEHCVSVQVKLVTEPPRSTYVIVCRGRKSLIAPVPMKPIRQLRPGDLVRFDGELRVVETVEPFR